MHAMQLQRAGEKLQPVKLKPRSLRAGEVRIKISACAVCRTDLHVMDGELPQIPYPVIPGHEIIGRISEAAKGVTRVGLGDRVGVPWLGWTCGVCEACRRGEENLCPNAQFTGYQRDGGFADEVIADARYVFAIPPRYSDEAAAPLMCAGLIGWRALKAAGPAPRLGLYGFGAAAHILIQAARVRGQKVFAFVRPGDDKAAAFATQMGAVWTGYSDESPPEPLDAAIIFAPVGNLVPQALKAVRPGGTVVCAGIHMSDIPRFPYALIWGERTLKSVANLTRQDGEEFMEFAGKHEIVTHTQAYPLADANRALDDLREGRLSGAAVLVP